MKTLKKIERVSNYFINKSENIIASSTYKTKYLSANNFVENTKESWERSFFELLELPLKKLKKGNSNIALSGPKISTNGKRCDGLECFARTFLAYALYFYGKEKEGNVNLKDIETLDKYKVGIINGVNPLHKNYWGKINSPQILVENGSFSLGLLLVGKNILCSITEKDKKILMDWFEKYSKHNYGNKNWQWFKIFHLLLLEKLGEPQDVKEFENSINVINELYCGKGWYTDGKIDNQTNFDYYNAWGMHFFGLMFYLVTNKDDALRKYKKYSKIHLRRAKEFIKTYKFLLPIEGPPLFYGRSQIYRFASVCLTGIGIETGIINSRKEIAYWKKCSQNTINYFLEQKIFSSDKRLSIGYTEESLPAAETYSGTGSPYFSLIGFTPLMLPKNHVFWKIKTTKLKTEKKIVDIKSTCSIIKKSNNELMLVNGKSTRNDYPSKYNKFVYSNLFSPDIDKKSVTNTLLLKKPGSINWCSKRRIIKSELKKNTVIIHWMPESIQTADITTVISPNEKGYTVSHKINTNKRLLFAAGGFTIDSKPFRKNRQKYLQPIIKKTDNQLDVITHCAYSKITLIRCTLSKVKNKEFSIRKTKNANPSHKNSHTPFLKGLFEGNAQLVICVEAGNNKLYK